MVGRERRRSEVGVEDPAAAVAELLAEAAARGRPHRAHRRLDAASAPTSCAARADADWSGATVWFGDERCVPPDDADSNFADGRPTRCSSGCREPRRAVMRMEGELGPDAGAGAYEARAARAARRRPALRPRCCSASGPDAHTASLFPGKPEVEERRRLVVGVPEAGMEPQVPRVTLTLPALNAAREVVFLVTGADKAEAVARAFGDPPDPTSPAAHVRPRAGTLLVLLDDGRGERSS